MHARGTKATRLIGKARLGLLFLVLCGLPPPPKASGALRGRPVKPLARPQKTPAAARPAAPRPTARAASRRRHTHCAGAPLQWAGLRGHRPRCLPPLLSLLGQKLGAAEVAAAARRRLGNPDTPTLLPEPRGPLGGHPVR